MSGAYLYVITLSHALKPWSIPSLVVDPNSLTAKTEGTPSGLSGARKSLGKRIGLSPGGFSRGPADVYLPCPWVIRS